MFITNTVRGTQHLTGEDAAKFRTVTSILQRVCEHAGYQEIILSNLAPQGIFVSQAGQEILSQMWAFQDKGGRDVCLLPEATAVIAGLWKSGWSKTAQKPLKLWYLQRCYRYERPQLGRYREFWQFGVERLGDDDKIETPNLLIAALRAAGIVNPQINQGVTRGLAYYTQSGFEVECPQLGAQSQIAGGGRYDCGIGWAIGVERLMLLV